ncbi:acetyl-coA carboxylase beta subunit (chloroplast) [Amborella trichopoda]|uniref:Acetyl-coenzyme A carboxylase carboxyl transferase subunit beta, chloroplastic n=1 Tax=Amborella trichopoda TaxID=13333 RepID=ACCD_AMBTC|nr:acetyl-CoA carboxylase beta subunit [Amborella trichopoda]Q70XZ4.1 RecName: Full=Acetyl-coenzyme A carboxylase carboxyl transferase subunit beta, chloroplastic; Short=ACCase subunit beta; Short=Acetyl-CoA carboxylase carboxyltransferase subunit beta [Amborella trichopoda]CAD45116.1 acetyl-coA carboxylase beta subunit [Amborella trichopoda]|eukprot:NP_904108.1 acetyl-coA carboxylase beta subunit (chloroplast) [Amborella trichopoda]
MEKCGFNSMLSNEELEHKCELSKSMDSLGLIGNTGAGGGPTLIFDVRDILSLIYDDTFKLKDRNGDSYSVYFDIDNKIFEIDDDSDSLSGLDIENQNQIFFDIYNDSDSLSELDSENKNFEIHNESDFMSKLESSFFSYLTYSCLKRRSSFSSYPTSLTSSNLNSGSKSYNPYYDPYMHDTRYSWNNDININSCIDSYIRCEIDSISSGSDNCSDSYIYSYICSEGVSYSDNGSSSIRTRTSTSSGSSYHIRGRSNNFEKNKKLKKLWVQCENCYALNYNKLFRSKMNVCEQCGYHLKMSSSDRIELSIDPGTWHPMDEDMVSTDPIEFHSEEEPYRDRIDSYQRQAGLTDAVQTGIGQLEGIPIAIGVMDFQFMGGSMGSVVGEKITRLIEYAIDRSLPVVIVCASGGARMQEGGLSLMQMAKISSASYNYQSNKKLFYVSILTSPTTGGVTASFGMLGDIIIAEPNAYVAFAGKRVIEETLNKKIPDGLQVAEYSFHKGLFDSIVPRNPLKGVPSELFQLHGFFSSTFHPLKSNKVKR